MHQLSIVSSRTGTLASNVLPWLLATWTASKFPIYPARRSRTLAPDALITSSGVKPPSMLLCPHRWMSNVDRSLTKRTHILVNGHRNLCGRMLVLQAQEQMKDVLAFWRGPIRGSAWRASDHTRRQPVLVPRCYLSGSIREKKTMLTARNSSCNNERRSPPTAEGRSRQPAHEHETSPLACHFSEHGQWW
jgi:hypothetical protein